MLLLLRRLCARARNSNASMLTVCSSILLVVSFAIVDCEDDLKLCPDGSNVARNVDDQVNKKKLFIIIRHIA